MENENISDDLKDYRGLKDYVNEEIRNIGKSFNKEMVLGAHNRACGSIGTFRDKVLHKGKEYYIDLTEVLDDRVNTARDNKLKSLELL